MYLLISGNAGSQSIYTFSFSSLPLGSFPKWFIHLLVERIPVKLWPEGQKGMEAARRFLYHHLSTTLPNMCPFLNW